MPTVKHLQVDAVSLAGIERYPTVEHLKLNGIFEDLSPLTGLPALTELTLRGEQFSDLSPLARLPSLRRLKLERKRGLILDPLLEAPKLRVVEADDCRVIATELASLNAAIGWRPEDFALDTPRAQPPLRLICYDHDNPETDICRKMPAAPDGREFAKGDETFEEAECAWLVARLKKCLNAHLSPGWGGVKTFDGSGPPYVAFFRDIEPRSAWSMMELMRSALADTRYPWELHVCFDEAEENEWQESPSNFDEDGLYIETPDEREEDRRRARDQRALLEREHQLRLGAQGLPVPAHHPDPVRVEPPPEPEPVEAETVDDTYVPPTELRLTLTEEAAWIHTGWLEPARVILEREPEDWHALPGPIEKRPRPA